MIKVKKETTACLELSVDLYRFTGEKSHLAEKVGCTHALRPPHQRENVMADETVSECSSALMLQWTFCILSKVLWSKYTKHGADFTFFQLLWYA